MNLTKGSALPRTLACNKILWTPTFGYLSLGLPDRSRRTVLEKSQIPPLWTASWRTFRVFFHCSTVSQLGLFRPKVSLRKPPGAFSYDEDSAPFSLSVFLKLCVCGQACA